MRCSPPPWPRFLSGSAAIFLRYYADLDYASIAEALGVKGGTVAASLNAAHDNLSKTLQEAVR